MKIKKKNLLIRIFTATLSVVLIIGTLSGCGWGKKTVSEPPATPQLLSIVMGSRQNNQGLNLSSDFLQETILETIYSQGFISVVCVDGTPELVIENEYTLPSAYSYMTNAQVYELAETSRDELSVELNNVAANDPEADLLSSLRLAVRTFSDVSMDGERNIVVLDNGISTTGIMDFSENLIEADPTLLAESLAEKSAIPDFSGCTVTFLQLGDTVAPQEDLTDLQREKLVDIWRTIIEKGGGTFKTYDITPNSRIDYSNLPEVSAIEFPDETPISLPTPTPEVEEAVIDFDDTDVFIWDENTIAFEPDSAEYCVPSDALALIQPVADYMLNDPEFMLLIVGGCAGDDGDAEYCEKLSSARAETVKGTLISLGVESERVITVGMGQNDPWHDKGAGLEGSGAEKNRHIVLLDANGETCRELNLLGG